MIGLTIRLADGGVTLTWEFARWTEWGEEEGGGWVLPTGNAFLPTARWPNPCICLLDCHTMASEICQIHENENSFWEIKLLSKKFLQATTVS